MADAIRPWCAWAQYPGKAPFLGGTVTLPAEDGLDVAEIAASYGGGGHRNAAGFQMPLGWEGEQ